MKKVMVAAVATTLLMLAPVTASAQTVHHHKHHCTFRDRPNMKWAKKHCTNYPNHKRIKIVRL